ncbi:hypothetical protein HMPREF1624_07507 [Sporothrix schenckii ATCC 58251]|uniref:Acetylserotonin methytransferase-like protein n=1 Tax=Sporothrix schenckii (strain ATCC 58251 / de Perez 2211183) TaxID=1391915 RepID=U7PK94_SPOS1|nr:hypothetical protein HMPREF1624_07507 [Sporothrix schenckii ATCC 58251]
MSATTPSGGFSLFPNTGRPPSRTQLSRPRAASPQQQQQRQRATPEPTALIPQTIGEAVTAEVQIPAPAAVADRTSVRRTASNDDNEPGRNSSVRSRSSIAKVRLSMYDDGPPMDDDPPPPMPTGAATLAEQQLQQQSTQDAQRHRPPALRSIFPQYNPDVSLDEQNYFPTQTSPTRIPRSVISRPLYSPVSTTQQQSQQPQQPSDQNVDAAARTTSPAPGYARSASVASPARQRPTVHITPPNDPAVPPPVQVHVPMHSGPVPVGHPRGDPPSLPVPSTSDDLRSLWKVANGWKAGPSEGRVFCLRMSCDRDAPVYRLSSANHQPFYRLRLDPTSMSAYVTVSRHDPARPFKLESKGNINNNNSNNANSTDADADGAEGGGGSSSRNSVLDMGVSGGSIAGGGGGGGVESSAAVAAAARNARFDGSKNWQVALTTTLEEEARRHQPQDGLVALLYPAAATRMALERPHDAAMVATAERECARLVWDDDTSTYFLVHPTLALPFAVTIERSSTWSRTAYTLEHRESPQHLARLTRDGTGAGYLEVDTGIASKIDAVYLVDVVVTALLLVAHNDGQFAAVEQFAPPPDSRLAMHQHGLGHHDSAHASLVNMVLGGAMGRGGTSRQSMRDGAGVQGGGKRGSASRKSSSLGLGFFSGKKSKSSKGRPRMDDFDLDLESQTSIDLSGKMFEMGPVGGGGRNVGMMDNGGTGGGMTAKASKKRRRKEKDEDKMPGCLRLITVLFKCCFWCVAMVVRAILAIVGGLFKCVTSEKLL